MAPYHGYCPICDAEAAEAARIAGQGKPPARLQVLVLKPVREIEMLEEREVERDGKRVRGLVPVHYPIGHPGKQGPVHVVTRFECEQGHYITTEDRPEDG